MAADPCGQAILEANNAAGADNIHFNIGSGFASINPATELPTITGPVTINAGAKGSGVFFRSATWTLENANAARSPT